MDTINDYEFALQLQNELIDLTHEGNTNFTTATEPTKSNSFIGHSDLVDSQNSVIDLTNYRINDTNKKCQPIKRPRHSEVKVTQSIVDYSWEILDPNPDIYGLLLAFNRQYFWNTLDSVVIQWSKKMTVCAGLCRYEKGLCSISLSEPLLKLRPRKDLVETILHEMIHAYLFLTNNKNHRDRDGHGSEFCKHMYRINVSAGTQISIYHNFHEEVKLYKQHWWKCNGPCKHNKPFYGYVKRSINRPPGPNDTWWANHKAICNGNFIKVKEPEGYGIKKKKEIPKQSVKPINKITNFIKILDSPTKNKSEANININPMTNESIEQEVKKDINLQCIDETTLCPVCNECVFSEWLNSHLQNCSQLKEMFGNEIEDECPCPACNVMINRLLMNEHLNNCNMLSYVFESNDSVSITNNTIYVNCPICDKMVKENNVNEHLDICLPKNSSQVVENKFKCPCCENKFNNIIELDNHVDSCLLD